MQTSWNWWLGFSCAGALTAIAATGTPVQQPQRVEANRMVEFTFTSTKAYPDPFNAVVLDAVFTASDGRPLRVPAFWDGGQTWRVRFASSQVGIFRYRTECSDPANASLHGLTGTLEVKPYAGRNAFYRHGPVRVAADRRHFEHRDGTPFLWLADTWWMGLCGRLYWPYEFKTLTADRVAKGFNVVQIVAGLYPDMPAFDARGANEAGFPWTPGYTRINPEYFDAADRRIAWLADEGIAPCIVGAWGYHLPWLGVERMKKHWRNLVARYGAYPVFWCLAGEGLMPYYLSANKPSDREFQKKGWTEVAAYLRQIDPYHHPVSIHPADMARTQLADPALLDFDMLQTGHSDRGSIPSTITLVRKSRAAEPVMPTINAEVCYEGILGTCFADVERFMAWTCLLSGTAGHTYGANGIWQVNRREKPYGKSPHGGNWGTTPWDDAMKLPGSRQVGLAKRLLERYEWWRFEPRADWATFAEGAAQVQWGDWIWFPEGNPAKDAPVARRYFRRTLEVVPTERIATAVLRLGVDDRLTAYVNGVLVGSHRGWKPYQQFNVASLLKPGKNMLAILAENVKASVPSNPAGMICDLEIVYANGLRTHVVSDASWRCSQQEAPGWTGVDFADQGWRTAMLVGANGDAPWGSLDSTDAFTVPYAAGIPGEVRVIYVPLPRPITVHGLEPALRYRAFYFNPTDGASNEFGVERAQANGTWMLPAPDYASPDWVAVLEAVK